MDEHTTNAVNNQCADSESSLDNNDEEKRKHNNSLMIETINQTKNVVMNSTLTESNTAALNHRKQLFPISRLTFFGKSIKIDGKTNRRLRPFEIFRYADKWDVLLMINGTITAIIAGASYSLYLLVYKQMADHLVDKGKLRINTTILNQSITNSSDCHVMSIVNATHSPYNAINENVKYSLLIGFLNILFCWMAWGSWTITAERQIRRIRYKLFRNILYQEIGWFDMQSAGELSGRLIIDLDKIKDGISNKMVELITLMTESISILIYALIAGWKLTLVYVAVMPFIILIFYLTTQVTGKYISKEMQAYGSASSVVQEVLQNIRLVTSFHGQKKENQRFHQILTAIKSIGIRKGFYIGICRAALQIFNNAAFAITFWYGPQLVRSDCTNYSAGTVIVVFMACKITAMNLSLSVPNIQSFIEALSGGGYIFDLLERKSKIDASIMDLAESTTVAGDIEFKNVSFSYPNREKALILRNLSLKIPSGKTVALIGASGCGKSTIVQLIQRFYDIDNGRILLDGKDIKTLNVGSLRKRIGIVSQEPVLFTGTIADNIRLGNSNATEEQIVEAAKMANAHDFIMLLPKNYQTRISEKLSGGQKQRVAIARALVSKPQILLLDEATSALDNKSERIVQDALDRAKIGRTTIIVAHRLNTIRNADLIIGLEQGHVIECGTHDELMKHKGLYYEMVTAQQQKEKEEEAECDDNDSEEYNDNDDIKVSIRKTSELSRKTSKHSNYSVKDMQKNNNEDTVLVNIEKKRKQWFDMSFVLSILKLNASEWHWMVIGVISCIVFGAIQIAAPFILAQIYELFAEPDLEKQKYWTSIYAVIIFVMGVVSALVEFANNLAFAKSGETFTMHMRDLAFTSILRQDMEYFDHETNSPESLATRLSQESAALKELSGIRIGKMLEALTISIGAIIVSFSFGWKLTFVIICLAPLITFSGKLLSQKTVQATKSKVKHLLIGTGDQYANQAIEHIRTVVALHREDHFLNIYKDRFDQQFKKQMYNLHLFALGSGVALSMPYFINCVAFAYGSQLVQNNEMTFGDVFRVYFVLNFAMQAIGRSIGGIPEYVKAKKAALEILELSKRRSNIDPNEKSGNVLKEVKGDIEFQNVYFRYPAQPSIRILQNFSLKCISGKTTALVGPSGSGKSTLIGLIQRFYQPLKGKILLDGHDISELNIEWLRSLMGLVQQEPVLFNLSIRENIAYGDNSRDISDAEIEKAARDANIHDFIIRLPNGYETLCGSKGSQLSGGQKQRIAIARALIRQPTILLLDEATSALDNKSEQIVHKTLEKAKSGRTCLQIAHRLSTIQSSEKIAVIDHGKVKEQGTHDELLQLKGIYSQLTLAHVTST